jgi:hypothetical protein
MAGALRSLLYSTAGAVMEWADGPVQKVVISGLAVVLAVVCTAVALIWIGLIFAIVQAIVTGHLGPY